MDQLSEASGTRILTARHISDKTLPAQNSAVNTSLLCHSYSTQPHLDSYFTALQSYYWVLLSCGLLLVILTCVLFVLTMRAARRHWRDCISNVGIVVSVYPLVTICGFIVVVLPRSRIVSEAVAQQAVMIALYHFFCILIKEGGGPEKFVGRAGGARMETRVLPCCCWPCCVIPRPKLETRHLTWLRYLVLQMPIMQALIYVIILVLWSEDMELYVDSFVYITPFIAASILSGVWGVIMCVRAAESAGLAPRARYLSVQLVLIIVKLQMGFGKILPEIVTLPCVMPLHPAVFVHMLQHSLMMVEMLLLSIWAWWLYSKPPGVAADRVRPSIVSVAVIEDTAGKDLQDKSITSNNNVIRC